MAFVIRTDRTRAAMTAAMRGLIILFFMVSLFRFSGCSPRRPFCRAGRVAFRGQNKASPRTETDRGDTGMNGKLTGAFALLEKIDPGYVPARRMIFSGDPLFGPPAAHPPVRNIPARGGTVPPGTDPFGRLSLGRNPSCLPCGTIPDRISLFSLHLAIVL